MKKKLSFVIVSMIFLMTLSVTSAFCEIVYDGDLQVFTRSEYLTAKQYSIVNGSAIFSGDLETNHYTVNFIGFQLEEVHGNMRISTVGLPFGLTGLDNLTTIDGCLQLDRLAFVNNLMGLRNLETLGSLVIQWSPDLRNVDGLESLTHIGGDVFIEGEHEHIIRGENATITSLDGLGNLETVDGDFEIRDTDVTSMACFNTIEYIGGDLIISGNDFLTELGFENLVYVGGSVHVVGALLPYEQIQALHDRLGK